VEARVWRSLPHEASLVVPHSRTAEGTQDGKALGRWQVLVPILRDACKRIFFDRWRSGNDGVSEAKAD
jgi:hypothetical protein